MSKIKWTDPFPHWHWNYIYDYEFQDNNVTEASNYCRYVEFKDIRGPSCFTTNPIIIKPQECLITVCSELQVGTHPNCKYDRRVLQYMGKVNVTIDGKVCWPWVVLKRKITSESLIPIIFQILT